MDYIVLPCLHHWHGTGCHQRSATISRWNLSSLHSRLICSTASTSTIVRIILSRQWSACSRKSRPCNDLSETCYGALEIVSSTTTHVSMKFNKNRHFRPIHQLSFVRISKWGHGPFEKSIKIICTATCAKSFGEIWQNPSTHRPKHILIHVALPVITSLTLHTHRQTDTGQTIRVLAVTSSPTGFYCLSQVIQQVQLSQRGHTSPCVDVINGWSVRCMNPTDRQTDLWWHKANVT